MSSKLLRASFIDDASVRRNRSERRRASYVPVTYHVERLTCGLHQRLSRSGCDALSNHLIFDDAPSIGLRSGNRVASRADGVYYLDAQA